MAERAPLPRRRDCLSPGTAERVRGLVDEVFGPGYWDGFQGYICTPSRFGHEWRFMGTLGFGGKLHLSGGRLYVGCYPEDRTAENDELIERVNARLAEIVAEAVDSTFSPRRRSSTSSSTSSNAGSRP